MDKSTARELMDKVMDLNASINAVMSQIELIDVDEQKLFFRRSIAGVMDKVHSDLMRPIIREYSELNPDID